MRYTIDYLLSQLADKINVADPQTMRTTVLDLLRVGLWPLIGLDLIGVPYQRQVAVGRDRRVSGTDDILTVTDASDDGYIWSALDMTGAPLPGDRADHLTMVRDPFGVSFPYYEGRSIWLRGKQLYVDEAGDLLIPDSCYLAAYNMCMGDLLSGQYQHPLFAQRMSFTNQVPGLCSMARAQLVGSGSAAQQRAQQIYARNQYYR